MQMPPDMFERYQKSCHSFAMDPRQVQMDQEVRNRFKVPSDRYYSVVMWPPSMQGTVTVDPSRTRYVEKTKISKSSN